MNFLTDFADQGVILPVIFAVGVVLAAYGWWRAALMWFVVTGGTLGVVLTLKFGFIGCGPVFAQFALRSPSGHTAAAAIVAGGLAAPFTRRRAVVFAVATLSAVAIGLTRLALAMHSTPEVVLGGVIGVLGSLALAHFVRPPATRPPVVALAVAVLLTVLLHGRRLPAEPVIERAAMATMQYFPACRADVGQAK